MCWVVGADKAPSPCTCASRTYAACTCVPLIVQQPGRSSLVGNAQDKRAAAPWPSSGCTAAAQAWLDESLRRRGCVSTLRLCSQARTMTAGPAGVGHRHRAELPAGVRGQVGHCEGADHARCARLQALAWPQSCACSSDDVHAGLPACATAAPCHIPSARAGGSAAACAPSRPAARPLARAGRADQFFETEGYEARGSNVMRTVGYFSLVGLQRVHALIGDYHTALAVLAPIQPFQKARLFTQKISGGRTPAARVARCCCLSSPGSCTPPLPQTPQPCKRGAVVHVHTLPRRGSSSSQRSQLQGALSWQLRRLQHHAVLQHRLLLPHAAALPGRRACVQHRPGLHQQACRSGPPELPAAVQPSVP